MTAKSAVARLRPQTSLYPYAACCSAGEWAIFGGGPQSQATAAPKRNISLVTSQKCAQRTVSGKTGFGISSGAAPLALFGGDWAGSATEIEPFKTAIISKFTRAWPYVAYAGILLAIGLFSERA